MIAATFGPSRTSGRSKPRSLRLTMPEPLERDLQSAILKLLAVHPAVHRAWRVNSGAAEGEYIDARGVLRRQYVRFNTQRGHSDLIGVLKDGRALFLEVKRSGQQPTLVQQSFLDDMVAGGALAACVHSVDEAKAVLDGARTTPRGCPRFHSPYSLDD